jgi:hypothetical protein
VKFDISEEEVAYLREALSEMLFRLEEAGVVLEDARMRTYESLRDRLVLDSHTRHCCADHGCKYGDSECYVATGYRIQEHPCERCTAEQEDTIELLTTLLARARGEL